MRKIVIALVAVAAVLLGVTPVALAAAPTPQSTSDSHGRIVGPNVVHPTHRDWFAQVAVDMHYGFNGPVDADADAVSPVGRISKGTGVTRVQVDQLRVGLETGGVTDDFRIAADPAARNDGLTPARPLSSGTGRQALGYGDWQAVACDSPSVAARVFYSIRWSDGSLTRGSLRSNYTDPDPDGCGPHADLETSFDSTNPPSPFPGEPFTYAVSVTNNGPNTANGVTETFNFDDDLQVDDVDAGPSGTCDSSPSPGNVFHCNLGSLSTGEVDQISVHTRTAATGPQTSTATVTSTSVFADSDTATVTTTVRSNCVTSHTTLTDRPDSGENGNDWASDDLSRTVQVCQEPTLQGNYHATLADDGTFAADAGNESPGAPIVDICQDTPGSVHGRASFTFLAEPNFATYDDDAVDGHTFSGTAPGQTSEWMSLLFSDVGPGDSGLENDWKWTYDSNLSAEVWVNAAGGNSGDITGAPCPVA